MRDTVLGTDREPVYGANGGNFKMAVRPDASEQGTPVPQSQRRKAPSPAAKALARSLLGEFSEADEIQTSDGTNVAESVKVLQMMNNMMMKNDTEDDSRIDLLEMVFERVGKPLHSMHFTRPFPTNEIEQFRVSPSLNQDPNGKFKKDQKHRFASRTDKIEFITEKYLRNTEKWRLKKARVQLNNEFMDVFFTHARDH